MAGERVGEVTNRRCWVIFCEEETLAEQRLGAGRDGIEGAGGCSTWWPTVRPSFGQDHVHFRLWRSGKASRSRRA